MKNYETRYALKYATKEVFKDKLTNLSMKDMIHAFHIQFWYDFFEDNQLCELLAREGFINSCKEPYFKRDIDKRLCDFIKETKKTKEKIFDCIVERYGEDYIYSGLFEQYLYDLKIINSDEYTKDGAIGWIKYPREHLITSDYERIWYLKKS